MYINVYSCFVSNNQKLNTAQMSFIGQQAKQTVAHTYHGILLSNKNRQKPKPRVCTLTATWRIYRLLHRVNE